MINETTEGQEAGEQREALFCKVVKAGNKILEILSQREHLLLLLTLAFVVFFSRRYIV